QWFTIETVETVGSCRNRRITALKCGANENFKLHQDLPTWIIALPNVRDAQQKELVLSIRR
ncbi:MAG: hypothetical protein ABJC05_03485, partial [Pyrinomonadaceae bacterium]